MDAAEQRGLRLSIAVSSLFAVAAFALGIVIGSRVLIFDGVFVAIGIVLTWLSLRASSIVSAGPTIRYPFGRDALTPLVVLIQGIAVLATLLYAASDAIVIIKDGGRPIDPLFVVVYATISTVVGFIVAVHLNRRSANSDLLQAEAIGWHAGAVRSLLMAIGALLALVLAALAFTAVLDYIDPILVLISCALVLPLPIRLLKFGVNELLEGAPSPDIAAAIGEAVAAVRTRFGLGEPVLRSTKLGRKLYVEAHFVGAHDEWTVAEEDEVRRAFHDHLVPLGLDLWTTIEVTSDPEIAD